MEIVTLKQARERGLFRYFTGESCKRGHIVERLVSTRTCLSCKLMHKLRWQTDNAEKHQSENRRRSAEWRADNRERHRAKTREIYWRNPDKARESTLAWMRLNPEKCAQYHRNRRGRLATAPGAHTAADIRDILRLQGGRCAYCRVGLRKKKHIDHIIPLACGGSNDRSNLQILCPSCNLSKRARDPIEFAQSLGRLL